MDKLDTEERLLNLRCTPFISSIKQQTTGKRVGSWLVVSLRSISHNYRQIGGDLRQIDMGWVLFDDSIARVFAPETVKRSWSSPWPTVQTLTESQTQVKRCDVHLLEVIISKRQETRTLSKSWEKQRTLTFNKHISSVWLKRKTTQNEGV